MKAAEEPGEARVVGGGAGNSGPPGALPLEERERVLPVERGRGRLVPARGEEERQEQYEERAGSRSGTDR